MFRIFIENQQKSLAETPIRTEKMQSETEVIVIYKARFS